MITKFANNSIGFTMTKIETKQFAIFEENYVKEEKLQMSVDLSFSVNTEKHIIGVSSKVTFSISDKLIVLLEVLCHFKIQEESWISFLHDYEIKFPVDFLRHISMHTIGTSRGILHSRTENTIFNCIILPPINVTQIVTEDLIISIKETTNDYTE